VIVTRFLQDTVLNPARFHAASRHGRFEAANRSLTASHSFEAGGTSSTGARTFALFLICFLRVLAEYRPILAGVRTYLRWRRSVEGVELLPVSYTCSRCKCHALCRIRRKGLARILSIFGLRPVICLTCGKKSYMMLAEKDRSSSIRERVRVEPVPHVTPVRRGDHSRNAA
jgi:hypothetical protein